MIVLHNKKDCCGCHACVQKCPRRCIEMREDEEGFLYPYINLSICVECGLCEKVCPVINQSESKKPLEVYAAKNSNEQIRFVSSSGGIFTILAESILRKGGVVFGARFNEKWDVIHSYAETIDEVAAFRGSKYVQSCIGNSYQQVKMFLDQGREVLFSGTPCQIAGLRLYLQKKYENLTTVDFICHGVPSPGVFRRYLNEEIEKFARQGAGKNTVLSHPIHSIPERDTLSVQEEICVEGISFRDKTKGWKKYSFALILSKALAAGEKNSVLLSYTLNENVFMRGFLHDLYLRPSCYDCPSKQLKSGSDLTLGDYWGIASLMRELDDDLGISAVTVNTRKGLCWVDRLRVDAKFYIASYEDLCRKNSAFISSASIPGKRAKFFIEDGHTFHEKIACLCRPTLKERILQIIRVVLGDKGIILLKRMFGNL